MDMLLISSNYIVSDKLIVKRHLLRYITFCYGHLFMSLELAVTVASMKLLHGKGVAEVARVPLLRAHS